VADPFSGAKVDPVRLRSLGDSLSRAIADEVAKQAKAPTDWPLTTMPYAPSYTAPAGLTPDDMRRIAEAVCDEQERREASPLRVTAEDRRRWLR